MTELLHEILHSIAYERNPPVKSGAVGFKRPSQELISLSLVNRRIRNVALGFLFQHVQIDRNVEVVRLLKWCQSHHELSKLVKYVIHRFGSMAPLISAPRTLRFDRLGYSEDSFPENVALWLQLLPLLPSLRRIEIGDWGYPNSVILEAMHKHNKVSSIIFDDFLQMPGIIDLAEMSKITVARMKPSRIAFSYLARGMAVNELAVPQFDSFYRVLSTDKAINFFSSLRKITLWTSDRNVELSQLPQFITSWCPNLEIIQFIGTCGHLDSVPSISVFFEKLLEIDERVADVKMTLSRQSLAVTESPGQWLVTEMSFPAQDSWEEIILLICQFFPKLEHLELQFSWSKTYPVVGCAPFCLDRC